ncbi:MAG: LysM peptidoglycan-binding domain-containing protein [Anaerolineae bacterium]|nr:LysM peptidoglycan-binding domain-containing protein [Anaerolineae bacterium]
MFVFKKKWRMLSMGLLIAAFIIAIPVAAESLGTQHVVQRGETLFRIGLRYGVTVEALARANGIANPNRIYAGQVLIIPDGSGVTAPAAQPAPAAAPGAAGSTTHIVQRGEYLTSIGRQYGVTAAAIAQANGLTNPNLVFVGQRLIIPATSGVAPAPAALVPAPTSAQPTLYSGKQIVVDLSDQAIYAFENGALLKSSLVSTGLPATPTVQGDFSVYIKYESTTMSGPGYYLPGVPYTMYFYRGYGIHGTYWHSNFGRPMSHGCVNLETNDALWFFNWAPVGTPVHVQW